MLPSISSLLIAVGNAITYFVNNSQISFFINTSFANASLVTSIPTYYKFTVIGLTSGYVSSVLSPYPQLINVPSNTERYEVSITPFNNYGAGIPTRNYLPIPNGFIVNPKAPVISLISSTSTSATINIIPDANYGASFPTFYRVYFFNTTVGIISDLNNTQDIGAAANNAVTSGLVTGLLPNTKYAVGIRTTNVEGRSAISNIIEFTT